MITPPAFLITLTQPWADMYGNSKIAPTLVVFVHVGALVLAGGLAIATDRATLRVDPANGAERSRQVTELAGAHRTVLGGLVFIVLSGILLAASDLEAHWASWIYWTKMALIVALLANGYRMTRTERTLAANDPAIAASAWGGLRSAAMVSMALWITITLFGVMLVNYA